MSSKAERRAKRQAEQAKLTALREQEEAEQEQVEARKQAYEKDQIHRLDKERRRWLATLGTLIITIPVVRPNGPVPLKPERLIYDRRFDEPIAGGIRPNPRGWPTIPVAINQINPRKRSSKPAAQQERREDPSVSYFIDRMPSHRPHRRW